MSLLQDFKTHLYAKKSKVKAELAKRFFKTGKGEYSEHDVFLGITIPELRKTAKEFYNLSLEEIVHILKSKFHEERLCALFILIAQYQKANKKIQKQIYDLYILHLPHINNWDLVDDSCHQIAGHYLFHYSKNIDKLLTLAKSKNIWYRRIAIVSTFYFIKNKHTQAPLQIALLLLQDKHDLIHKAVGWMLREMGKRNDIEYLYQFLNEHYTQMPRTMLRYAIEKFDIKTRAKYMAK